MSSNESKYVLPFTAVTPPEKSALEYWLARRGEWLRRLVENLLVDTFYVVGYFSDAVDKATAPTSSYLRRLARMNDDTAKKRLSPWFFPAAVTLICLLY
jgi:hypothetical protein